MESFTWTQARSLLERWGWSEDSEKAHYWTLDAKDGRFKPQPNDSKKASYWVRDGKARIIVPTHEDLECRDEYDDFVTCLAEIYGLNPHALERSLEIELC
mgnify:CR=1 FL=1